MALTARLALAGPLAYEPEDFFSTSLGVIFPDDVTNQHGDHDHDLMYTSPHLPQPLKITLAEPEGEMERRLFSHYLWNASLVLAELLEAGTLGLKDPDTRSDQFDLPAMYFNIAGLSTVELGAGTALPSMMASLLGATRVLVTDYPAPTVLATLGANMSVNMVEENVPLTLRQASGGPRPQDVVTVEGHVWGALEKKDAPEAPRALVADQVRECRHAFDRVFAADCLWMPWQHENLRRSVAWFLKEDNHARAWVTAGFHTGRENMRGFFDNEALRAQGLETERIWERDCDGQEREWVFDRGSEDVTVRKRWQVIAVLKRITLQDLDS